jgi:hypothetical protein
MAQMGTEKKKWNARTKYAQTEYLQYIFNEGKTQMGRDFLTVTVKDWSK